MEARSLRFAAAARALSDAARSHGFEAPSFRSPPRVAGVSRTIRRKTPGTSIVSVAVRDRPWSAVVADMIDGFAAVNPDDQASALRDMLWAVIECVELPALADAA
ncbi:MAG: hypothetical protein ACR2PK_18670 [Acidimicrobiales bacterium]